MDASVYDTAHFCPQLHPTEQTAHCALEENAQTSLQVFEWPERGRRQEKIATCENNVQVLPFASFVLQRRVRGQQPQLCVHRRPRQCPSRKIQAPFHVFSDA